MAGFSQLAAEALQHAEGEQDVDKRIEEALACPCLGARVAELLWNPERCAEGLLRRRHARMQRFGRPHC